MPTTARHRSRNCLGVSTVSTGQVPGHMVAWWDRCSLQTTDKLRNNSFHMFWPKTMSGHRICINIPLSHSKASWFNQVSMHRMHATTLSYPFFINSCSSSTDSMRGVSPRHRVWRDPHVTFRLTVACVDNVKTLARNPKARFLTDSSLPAWLDSD